MLPKINSIATGENIARLLKERKIKVADLKQILGVNSKESIYKWIRGQSLPSLEHLVILAHVLDVTMDEIIIIERRA